MLRVYDKVLAVEPNNVRALLAEAHLLHLSAAYPPDVAHLYQQALRHDPGNVDALNNYGLLLLEQEAAGAGQNPEHAQKPKQAAEAVFGAALALNGNHVPSLCNLAALLASRQVAKCTCTRPSDPWPPDPTLNPKS